MNTTQLPVLKKTELLGHQFAVYGTPEEPLFLAKNVAEMLLLTNVSDMITRVDEDERSKLNLGRQGEAWFLTEGGLYEVLMQSRKPIAKQFKKGVKTILHEVRTTGSYTAPTSPAPRISDRIQAAKFLASFLNLNDASKLLLAKSIADPLGLPTPDYTPSKGILRSARELLKEHGSALTSEQFNKHMIERGMMTELTRPSSKGGVKKFKSIIGDGLLYGENQVNPQNPKSTQPLYYADSFGTLLAIVASQTDATEEVKPQPASHD